MPRWQVSAFQPILLSSYEFGAILPQWRHILVQNIFSQNEHIHHISRSLMRLAVKFHLFNPFRCRVKSISFNILIVKSYRENSLLNPNDVIEKKMELWTAKSWEKIKLLTCSFFLFVFIFQEYVEWKNNRGVLL